MKVKACMSVADGIWWILQTLSLCN